MWRPGNNTGDACIRQRYGTSTRYLLVPGTRVPGWYSSLLGTRYPVQYHNVLPGYQVSVTGTILVIHGVPYIPVECIFVISKMIITEFESSNRFVGSPVA